MVKYTTGTVFYCPSDKYGVKDVNNLLNIPSGAVLPGQCVYSATCKPEASYAYAYKLNNTLMYPSGVGSPYDQIMYTVAVDMSGAYSTAIATPGRWEWNLDDPTYKKNHGTEGVNLLKIDGHVEWSTLRDASGVRSEASAAMKIPNRLITTSTSTGYLANP